MRYQDVYPSRALLRSFDVMRPRAAELLNLEFFEAPPGAMPIHVFAQHHLLLNFAETPHRVENWRDGVHRDFTYRFNEIVVTPAGVASGWRWHASSKVIVITIEPEKLERFARLELGLILSDRQLRDIPQAGDADLCNAGLLLLEALGSRSTGSAVVYESLARVLLVKLLERYGVACLEGVGFGTGFTARQYKRVLDYIQVRFAGPVSVDELAAVAGLSPAHFSRLFKQVLGGSPHRFVMEYRVEQAKTMLADPERPLIDIALACGFSDQPHFGRVFRKVTGRTPAAFRKLVQQECSRTSQ